MKRGTLVKASRYANESMRLYELGTTNFYHNQEA